MPRANQFVADSSRKCSLTYGRINKDALAPLFTALDAIREVLDVMGDANGDQNKRQLMVAMREIARQIDVVLAMEQRPRSH
jgi:hypothetical protein